jgi:rhodanese-related sulfurtransferase
MNACTSLPSSLLRERLGRDPSLILLDVRTPAEFRAAHLSRAQLIPLDQLDASAFAASHGSDRECVVICQGGARARKAAGQLSTAGMNRVEVLEGGINAWIQAGGPVERGAKAISIERQVRIAAGTLVLIGTILGALVDAAFYALSAFIGAGLIFAGITDWCGMGLLLAKAPWNQAGNDQISATGRLTDVPPG